MRSKTRIIKFIGWETIWISSFALAMVKSSRKSTRPDKAVKDISGYLVRASSLESKLDRHNKLTVFIIIVREPDQVIFI